MKMNAYRRRYRSERIGPSYSGPLHLSFILTVGVAALVCCVIAVDSPGATDWLVIPVTFLYANLIEYWGHRGPMHHAVPGLRLIHERHARQHHRFFTHEQMAFDDSRDFKAVLFPPVMLLFFGALAMPYGLLLEMLWSANAAWLGVATAVAYYLNYELLHFAYHCAPASPVGRLPGLRTLRRLHHAHHDPRRMSTHNFNITYPIGDWVFGTLHRAGSRPEAEASGTGQSQKARLAARASRSVRSRTDASARP